MKGTPRFMCGSILAAFAMAIVSASGAGAQQQQGKTAYIREVLTSLAALEGCHTAVSLPGREHHGLIIRQRAAITASRNPERGYSPVR